MPYSKENVAYYKSRQRCTRCGRQDAFTLNGRSICADCVEKQRESYKRYRAERGAELNAQNKAYRAKMVEAGLCPNCGKPSDGGYVNCQRCRAVARQKMKRRRRESGSLPHGANGSCYTCNKRPALPGKRLCRECYEKSLASMAKAREAQRTANASAETP